MTTDSDFHEQLKRKKCWEKSDRVPGDAAMTRFRRQARLHQALWRARHDYPIGGQRRKGGDRRPVGSRLELEGAIQHGWNFLTPNTRDAVAARLATPQPEQMLDEERLWSDLLSSMPMCFNLFGELWNDRTLATSALRAWGVDAPGEVDRINFEWSPGRLDRDYLHNKSAFDAAFILRLPNAEKGVVGVEAKYHEAAVREKPPRGDKLLRYAEVTEHSGIFKWNWPEHLIGTNLQQLWLDHLLALSMKQHPSHGWSWVQFLLVYPERNVSFARAANSYRDVLENDESFQSLTLEQLLDAGVFPDALGKSLRERYLWT